jgi:solute carrier family 12 sodium/potassium/chloride transporter 2
MANVDEANQTAEIRKFGMLKGVFVPTLLTILGVIMYLRLGWVVGNVGLLGAWLIILIAFFITTATALSMSSIVSNMRIGPGGAYSIISRSLGLEIGGSIGVPLYLSLALSMALYIFGFRAGVLYLFPDISPLLIDLAIFGILFIIVFVSTDIAFRVQYGILAIIIGSIVSVVAAGIVEPPSFAFSQPPPGTDFWMVFAVFFPAATGIMAGANLSGELKDPRRSIPIGTLGAIAVSLAVYMGLAFWLAGSATRVELLGTYTIMIEKAVLPVLVLAGLLAATFSSALNSLVGASRVLQAMGEQDILPGSRWFTQRSPTGVPRNAILATGLIVVAALMLRDLNAIAPLITMFFLITYATINIVILVEQSLKLVSFRPLLRIPPVIPFIGTFGCLFAMFIINPVFSLVAILLVGGFYYVLMYRHMKYVSPYGDVRSSLFVALAEWAARKSKALPASQERAWRPHLLIPIDNPTEFRGVEEFVRDITYPRGSVSILGIHVGEGDMRLEDRLPYLVSDLRSDGVYADWTTLRADRFADATVASIQALKRAFFAPNILFLRMPGTSEREEEAKHIMVQATENLMGIILFAGHPKAGLGRRKIINLWISKRCMDWPPSTKLPNCNLAVLMAYELEINWGAALNIIAPVGEVGDASRVRDRLKELVEQARLPRPAVLVVNDGFWEYLGKAPQADLNIFILGPEPDFERIKKIVFQTRSTCLFCRDSTEESALV